MKYILSVVVFLMLSSTCYSQDEKPTWKEIQKQYKFPKWYTEARFGIWVHWGAQTEPKMGGGWYARHMYMEDVGKQLWGKNAYTYHQKTYGHQSEIGYKDVINHWKAENLDTDALLKYFKSLGAKYFVALANHHDHFDNWNSTYQKWNSVNVGPHRDIIGEFSKSAKKYGVPFGVSSHDDRFLHWWLPAFGADKTGPQKGVPYDGNMTKADGKGKWWEGLDPANLYGLPPEKRTDEWVESVKKTWLKRHTELVTKYNIDMVWFDGYGFPYKEYGKELCRRFLANDYKEHNKFTKVVVGKMGNEQAVVKDIERGGANKILMVPWQGITTFRTWFYKEDPESKYKHNARTIIELLSDYMSKNGNLLLNVELLPDGTIPPKQKDMLDDIGNWVNTNAEAIYASKPWKIYGDNLNSFLNERNSNLSETDLKAQKEKAKKEQFNERTLESPPYGHNEVRFTTNNGILYVIVLNPQEGDIEIPSLGINSEYNAKSVKTIRMVGEDKSIQFKQQPGKLILSVPAKRPNKFATVFAVEGVL